MKIKIDEYSSIENLIRDIQCNRILNVEPEPEIKHGDRSAALDIARKLIETNSLRWQGTFFECDNLNKTDIYRLTLTRKQSCSCSFKGTCAHLLALLIKMGLYNEQDKSRINFMNIIKSKYQTKNKNKQKHFRKIDKEKRERIPG